jgi:GNAT superfamily N-acetyltransferase
MARPIPADPVLAQVVEDVYVEYFSYLRGAPHLEVHCDADLVWKVSPGSVWSNCGVGLRLAETGAKKRLDGILARYRENGRGAGFWVFPGDQPGNLKAILASRALHCRKYFPAMYRDLAAPLPEVETRAGLEFSAVTDYDQFRRVEHPSIGRISTKFRRMRLETQRDLAGRDPRRCWDLMASLDGVPAGVCTLFLGERHAGVFDMGVPERLRNRGIGRALLRHACGFARDRGAAGVVLIATDPGYPMYERAGFREVAKVGYWYTAYP